MSFAERVQIAWSDTEAFDTFGRLRISSPTAIFDSKQIFDNAPLFWDDQEISGTGTGSSHSIDLAASTMTVGATTAGTRVRQTFEHFNYESGKSQLVFMTGVLGAGASGITRRIGIFNENNGLFFELADSTLKVVQRSHASGSPVDTAVAQSNWNIDKLDGTGPSGITLDTSKSQLFAVDYGWLGVAPSRFSVAIGNELIACHKFANENAISTVYMSTPNLPVRYEIANDGTGVASSLIHICASVVSEGGTEGVGISRGLSRDGTSLSTAADTALYPLLSIRLKSTHLGATVTIESISIVCTTTADFDAVVILNPTVAGSDAVSWTNVTNGAIQFDAARDNTNKLTGGTILSISTASQDRKAVSALSPVKTLLRLGSKIDATPDEIILAVRPLTGAAETFHASMTIRELV